MIFLVLSILFAALAFWPAGFAISGRIVAIYGAINCLSYYTFALDLGGTDQSGIVGLAADTSANIFSGYGLTAILLFALATFMSYKDRAYAVAAQKKKFTLKIPAKLYWGVILYTSILGLYMVSAIGFDTIISYEGYGTIKDAEELYGSNPIIKNILGSFRIAVILTITISIFAYSHNKGRIEKYIFSIVPIFLGLVIAASSSSRILAVYFAVAAISFYVSKSRFLASFSVILAILSLSFVNEARGHNRQGLLYSSEYLISSLSDPYIVETVLKSVSGGLQITSASINRAQPDAYSSSYKILSFAPTVSVVDNFPVVKAQNEQRIFLYVPFNAFGEAWSFGKIYYSLFWCIIFYSASCVNSSIRFGNIYFTVLFGAFLIGLVYASQYPVRNTARYFYMLIAMRYLLGYLNRPKRRQTPNRYAPTRRRSTPPTDRTRTR